MFTTLQRDQMVKRIMEFDKPARKNVGGVAEVSCVSPAMEGLTGGLLPAAKRHKCARLLSLLSW
jgi:hypothetical protein